MGDIINALLPEPPGDRRSGRDRRTTNEPMPEFLGALDSRRFPRRAEDVEKEEHDDSPLNETDVHLLLAEQCRIMAADTQNLETRLAFLEMAEDYENQAESHGVFVIRSTGDFRLARADAGAVCLSCNHSKTIAAATLEQWFAKPVRLEEAGARLRCPKCGHKGVRLSPVPA
jgi:DNA-directed RNA polymerase subunit RPC12/RpoP